MRYIGSKENLVPFIYDAVAARVPPGAVVCDLFAGTTAVGRAFKRHGYRVISNDLMAYAYVFGKAYLEVNAIPAFAGLDLPGAGTDPAARLAAVLARLNALPAEAGFIFTHYSDEGTRERPVRRMYFSAANAGRIDAIRNRLAAWSAAGQIDDAEFHVLLAALLEAIPGVSNTSGTYGAFLKYWERRAQKPLCLVPPPLVPGSGTHAVHQTDANALVRAITCDVLYLDPPYNSRQYATNYHLLETVARWDAPAIYGKSGLRPYAAQKSVYCARDGALAALDDLAAHARARLLVLSYNSEGLIPDDAIRAMLARHGRLTVHEQPYRRFRSDRDHAGRRYRTGAPLMERLYVVELPGAASAQGAA